MFDLHSENTALHHFAEANSDGLQNAALLLGGRPWLRRAQRFIDELQNGRPSRRCLNEAHALLDLLRLEHVHDLERPESGYFAELDPAMPYIEDICLLSEGLEAAIGETRSAPVLAPVSFRQEAWA